MSQKREKCNTIKTTRNHRSRLTTTTLKSTTQWLSFKSIPGIVRLYKLITSLLIDPFLRWGSSNHLITWFTRTNRITTRRGRSTATVLRPSIKLTPFTQPQMLTLLIEVISWMNKAPCQYNQASKLTRSLWDQVKFRGGSRMCPLSIPLIMFNISKKSNRPIGVWMHP